MNWLTILNLVRTLGPRFLDGLRSALSGENKDVRGALLWIVGIIVTAFLILTVTGCTISPAHRPVIEFGLGTTIEGPIYGRDPVGNASLYMPVTERCKAEYLHHSSYPDQDDLDTVDQLSGVCAFPAFYGVSLAAGAGVELDDSPALGRAVGVVRIERPIFRWLVARIEHLRGFEGSTTQLGVNFVIPLGRE